MVEYLMRYKTMLLNWKDHWHMIGISHQLGTKNWQKGTRGEKFIAPQSKEDGVDFIENSQLNNW